MKRIVSLLIITYFISVVMSVHADYVLPYPSYMPGNKLYKIDRIIDQLKRFWYFGNIAKVKYHLALSDKYLVEAKTLMEYNQFLLGADALTRSNKEFSGIPLNLAGAKNEGVDTTTLKGTIQEAAIKHTSVLAALQRSVPHTFVWRPEKSVATNLDLGSMIQSSEELRMSVASQAAQL